MGGAASIGGWSRSIGGGWMNDEERRQFTEMVADCTPTMLGLAYVITGSQPAAERTLRRALAKTANRWRRLGDLPPESHIVKIMCRYEVNWWHRIRRGLAAVDPDAPPDEVATGQPPGLRTAMRRALVALPPTQRVVMALRHHERLTEEETAEVLGLSVKQVGRHTDRAVVRLRELLAALSTPDQPTVQFPAARTPKTGTGGRPANGTVPAPRDGEPDADIETAGRHRREPYV